MPEAGCGQVEAGGQGDALPVLEHDVGALQEGLLILLVDEHVRLDRDQRLRIAVSLRLRRLLRLQICLRAGLLRRLLRQSAATGAVGKVGDPLDQERDRAGLIGCRERLGGRGRGSSLGQGRSQEGSRDWTINHGALQSGKQSSAVVLSLYIV